jgi:quercetin dioxygenase-like cupin family protein
MPTFIEAPTVIQAPGQPPKRIEEYVGRVNTKTEGISIARMQSPAGWGEPWQQPEFGEYTVVLDGVLRVEFDPDGVRDLKAGEAVYVAPGERVRYSSPDAPAHYVAVCLPAFSLDTVHREE